MPKKTKLRRKWRITPKNAIEVITPNNATVKYIIATESSFSFYGDAQSTASSFKKIQNTRETIFVVFFVSFH